jgi:hypothetical protein
MDSKKHLASLMEDHSSRPATASLRSLSPFRSGRRSSWARSGDGASTCGGPSQAGPELDLNQDQGVLSCVYVLEPLSSAKTLPGLTMRVQNQRDITGRLC